MQEYILNWSSSTKQTITLTPKVTLEPGTTSGTSRCSLVLFGKGAPRYGEGQQENFVRMLENFASNIAPIAPTSGQLWFDTTLNAIKIYDSDSTWKPVNSVYVDSSAPPVNRSFEGMLWYNTANSAMTMYQGGSWKSFATPVVVAGPEEYNMMVANYNLIAGSPTDVTDRAASFNGRTSLITVTGNSDLNLSTYTSGTIELWVCPKTITSMNLIEQGASKDWVVAITKNGSVVFSEGTYQTYLESREFDTVKLDEWNHIAVTFSTAADGVAIFLNGKLVAEKTGWTPPNSTANLYIGRYLTQNDTLLRDLFPFYGLMDCIRITKNVIRYTQDFDTSTLTNESYYLAPGDTSVKFLMRMDSLAEDTGKTVTSTDVVITPQAYGYGQIELDTQQAVNNGSWLNLLDKFKNIARHQGNAEALENISNRGFIVEPNAAQPINCGVLTLMREYEKTEHAVNSLIKNSSNLSTAPNAYTTAVAGEFPRPGQTSTISWTALAPGENAKELTVTLTFASVAASNAFFNAGGKIKISKSFAQSGSTGANSTFADALSLAGDTYIAGAFNTDTFFERGSFNVLYTVPSAGDVGKYYQYSGYNLIDYGGAISQSLIPPPPNSMEPQFILTKSRIMPKRDGYYGLSSSFEDILEVKSYQEGGGISGNPLRLPVRYRIIAKAVKQLDNTLVITVKVRYSHERDASINTSITGNLTTQVTLIKPSSTYLNSPTISFPAFSSTDIN